MIDHSKQDMNIILNIEHVTKFYGAQRAVDDVSFQVARGEIVALLGKNGAGKSTTFRLIAGLLTPDQGTISIQGKKFTQHEQELKHLIGYLAEQPFLYPTLSGIEFLELIGTLYCLPKTVLRERAHVWLERMHLISVARQRIQSYSQGMKRRLSICAILMHRPSLLLLDEPLNGLDPEHVYDMKQLMIELSTQNCAILVSTHLLDIAERFCSRAIIIEQGHVLADGNLDLLRQQAQKGAQSSLETIFFALTDPDR